MDEKNLPQAMRPHGLMGRFFGLLMETVSGANYRWVVAQLKPIKPKSVLEIGFGTGKLAELLARKFKPAGYTGIDPAPLMVATAQKKLRRFRHRVRATLSLGDDTLLATLDGPYDAIIAAHSFQFWSAPVTTLARIHALLSRQGRLVLVLRPHDGGRAPDWLPNPVSKSGDEIGGTRRMLHELGFRVVTERKLRTGSFGIVAEKA
jgi:ubiquinone/menaquinone biosynthesis C-methylase UbiE